MVDIELLIRMNLIPSSNGQVDLISISISIRCTLMVGSIEKAAATADI